MKIVNLDGYTTNPGDLSWTWLEKYGEYKIYDRTSPEDVLDRAKDADILIVNKTPISRELLEKLPKLKYVGLQSTGYNIIDCQAAKEKGIVVSNIPEYSTNAVAQLTFALILEITNQVALHNQSVHSGEWCACQDFCYWKTPLTELAGKTLGIIGFGKIGRQVCKIAQSFGMKVLAFSPSLPADRSSNPKIIPLDEIFRESDFITLHCPLTKDTENLINEENLKKMKKNAIIINTSRGPVVNEKDLARALQDGIIAGAAVDVVNTEPCVKENPLLKCDNCIITPHIAWAGFETRKRLLEILEKNLAAFLDNQPINVVNK